LKHISIHYTFLSINKSIPDSVAKYYNLRHKLSLNMIHQIFRPLTLSWNISYQDRYGTSIGYDQDAQGYFERPYEPFWLMDATLKWRIRRIQLFAEISNILNTRYIDAGSTLQAGRWLRAGVSVNFSL
jgi:iron complex outermembrane receptor protein